MTLNLHSLPITSANSVEDELPSPAWFDGSEKGTECFTTSCLYGWEQEDTTSCKRDGNSAECSCEPIARDILDLLPADPFGMNLGATFTAIADWLEDIEIPSEDSGSEGDGSGKDDYQVHPDLDFFWNTALLFGSESPDSFDGQIEDKEFGDASFDGGFVSIWDIEEILNFGDEDNCVAGHHTGISKELAEMSVGGEGGAPHDALEFVINYLDLHDRLALESVCRAMLYWTRKDSSLWWNIHVNQPLNDKLTDDALIKLTARAHGELRCLSLVECQRITDDGLRSVLKSNPTLTKLCVPGCTRLSVEGLMSSLKASISTSMQGVKCLRIGELYGVTREQFEELKLLLGAGKECNSHECPRMPRLYPYRHSYLCIDGGFGVIDLEICSRCGNPKILYDCPVEGCQGKPPSPQGCRACTLCIKRCCWCGICINNDSEYEETFSLEWICSGCWKEKALVAGPRHAIFCQEARYQFRVYC